jgi:hypothetical protein
MASFSFSLFVFAFASLSIPGEDFLLVHRSIVRSFVALLLRNRTHNFGAQSDDLILFGGLIRVQYCLFLLWHLFFFG